MTAVCYILHFIKDGEMRRYVGHTERLLVRIKQHLKALEKGQHHNKILQRCYNDGWKFTGMPSIRPAPDRETAYRMEQFLIAENRSNPEYVNIEGGYDTYTKNPDREKIRKKITKVLADYQTNLSDEERKAKALRQSGDGNGMFGRTHTPEARRHISEKIRRHYETHVSVHKGKPKSEAQRAALSRFASTRTGKANPFFGRVHSEKTKARLSEANKGKLPPCSRRISIDGVEYPSMTEASRHVGVHTTVVLFRAKSKNSRFSEWKLI